MSSHDLFGKSTRILVPVTLPDPEPLAPWLIDFLHPLDVYVVGCYQVKEQTSPEQAREQFGQEASDELETVVAQFQRENTSVTSRLFFTHDIAESTDRLAEDLEIDVVIAPASIERITNLLAVVTEDVHLDRLHHCISALLEDSAVPVTLLHVAGAEADTSDKEQMELVLDGLKQRLIDDGLDKERIEVRALDDENPASRTIDISKAFDIIVISETERSIRDVLLREARSPLLVVRPRSDEQA